MNRRDSDRTVLTLLWAVMILIAGYILGHILVSQGFAQEPEITKTCESVVVGIEVNWAWPNTFLNGPLICYPGAPDAQKIVNVKSKTVTFAGGVSALRILGVVE